MTGVITLPWNGQAWPGRIENGLPTFGFRDAPPGLATRRQLRARGLCPGRHGYVAQLKWRAGRRWAALYRLDLAAPTPGATLPQLIALHRAHQALRTCRTCHQVYDYRLPTSCGRECWTCWTTTESTHHTATTRETPMSGNSDHRDDTPDAVERVNQLGGQWAANFDDYASGRITAAQIRCVLCHHVPCTCTDESRQAAWQ